MFQIDLHQLADEYRVDVLYVALNCEVGFDIVIHFCVELFSITLEDPCRTITFCHFREVRIIILRTYPLSSH